MRRFSSSLERRLKASSARVMSKDFCPGRKMGYLKGRGHSLAQRLWSGRVGRIVSARNVEVKYSKHLPLERYLQ